MAEMTIEITNSCLCRYCEDCNAGYIGLPDDDACPECDAVGVWDGCMGCWEDMHECVEGMVDRYQMEHPSPAGYYMIEGSNMGWLHRSGYRLVDENDDWSDALAVRSEWTQVWTLSDDGKLTAKQYHHDAPMGESFTFRPATQDEADLA
ncbi:hypothetical protein [Brevibacterium moorei]|uniref:hypothetical protein n=1 Tax=Brevibacterium moorei TaxID=2968457 RepID=UPI00211CA28D|nr:hypothetical protein [Brevibacterium sp. 68QC2CO]MCQ9385137.1 hypothetical protein [Brevibacterium sp. 68QC2CO]